MKIGKLEDYKKFAKMFWPFLILGAILFFSIVNTFFKSRIENYTKYDFEISKLDKTMQNNLTIYDGDKEIYLWNYSIQANEGIRVGDIVYKNKCSKYLYILRKNVDGTYFQFRKENYTGMFPIQIFCDF